MRSFLIAVVIYSFLPATVLAQASITGTVRDSSGAVLPGVTVEASSPVLIEKMRTAVSDGSGQYRVVDLRPGAYTVKFTLSGFKTLERSGVELTGTFTALVNAELSVGELEETVTVSGEAPIVNVQSATKETNLVRDVVDAVPTSRTIHTLAVLLPGVSTAGGIPMMPGSQDVGGDRGGTSMNLAIHGSRGGDTLVRISGNALPIGGTATTPIDMGAMQEVNLETSALSIEEAVGGVRTSLIPREGGNTFSGSFFGTYANEHIQSNNFDEELRAAGMLAPNRIKLQWDVNPAFGGPVSRDRLWVFSSFRHMVVDRSAPGLPFNRNAYLAWDDPQGYIYAPDPSMGVPFTENTWFDGSARLTWQAMPKHKVAIAVAHQYSDNRPSHVGSTPSGQSIVLSSEAALLNRRPYYDYATADWTSPLTPRLLLEHHLFVWRFDGGFYPNENPRQDPRVIGIDDTGLGIKYRAWNNGSGATQLGPQREIRWRSAVSYVTGAHQYQMGVQFARWQTRAHTIGFNEIQYIFTNGVPVRINLSANPLNNWSDKPVELGLYASDKWTIGRLTLSGGARFDYLKSEFPETPQEPGPLFPERNFVVPGAPNVNWKDITYRGAGVYNLFGDGRTALRVSISKYLGLTTGLSNPNAIIGTATRAWTDANRNFIPDGCDLSGSAPPGAAGECGAISNPRFGQVVPGTAVDPDLREGWGKRFYNWEFTTGVQRELARGVSVDVGYFRRWYGNFTLTTNLATGPGDFDYFSVRLPTDPRLPNSGETIQGFVNLKPASFGRPSQNFVTFSDKYAEQTEHYNGIDVNLNARLAAVTLSGGFSTGQVSTNVCDLWAARPDLQIASAGATAGTMTALDHCDVNPGLTTQIKGFASYTIPGINVQTSAAVQNAPGVNRIVIYSATNADVATSLERTLTGGSTVPVHIFEPGEYLQPRLNQIDVRFAKLFQLRTMRVTPSIDIYNLLNDNTVQLEHTGYGSLGRPLLINHSRFGKFSVNIAF